MKFHSNRKGGQIAVCCKLSRWTNKKGRADHNGIREKTNFIRPFIPYLKNTDTEAACMTISGESGIHIASCKVKCNASNKSTARTEGSNLSTLHEHEHINHFDTFTCNNLKPTFHQKQTLPHRLSSELKGKVIAR